MKNFPLGERKVGRVEERGIFPQVREKLEEWKREEFSFRGEKSWKSVGGRNSPPDERKYS